MYIPHGTDFEFRLREIEGVKNFQTRDTQTGKISRVSHPGGPVSFLTEDSSRKIGTRYPHYPFVFAIPSLVTFTKRDMEEFLVDFSDVTASAPWPKNQLEACPLCRNKTVIDGKTLHVMCAQPAIMESSRNPGMMSMRLLFRSFCVSCFDSMAGQTQIRCPKTKELNSVTVLSLLKDGMLPPFTGNSVVTNAHDRYTLGVMSGLIPSIETDIAKYQGNSMGAKVSTITPTPGLPTKTICTMNNKVFETCCMCGKSSWEAHEGELGESRLRSLKLCGGCRQRRYCGSECQLRDWKNGHKAQCREIQKQKSDAAGDVDADVDG